MGSPSKTQVETWSDQVAAMLRKDLDGFEAEQGSKSETTLWDLVDLSGDSAVENALLSAALSIDVQSMPENLATCITTLCGRTAYRSFVTQLDSLVRSADGGSHASIRAYLNSISATVHPLFAELVRQIYGEGHFTSSSDVTEVFAPSYVARAPDRVYTGADGSLTDDTTDADDAGTADITLFAADDDALYIGSRVKFSQVVVGLSTVASATITPVVEYWNGNAWTAVSGLTDNSTGFTKNDTIKWTLPSDWARSYKDKGGTALADKTRLYYLRISRTANALVTPPVGTCIRIMPEPIYLSGTSHLGVQQGPLGIARITGVDTIVVEALNTLDYARFKEPGIRLRALTPFAANLTPTVSYTNQAGNDVTQAQSAWTAPAALGTASVTLNGADTGVRAVKTTGWACTTTAVEGVFAIEATELRTPAI